MIDDLLLEKRGLYDELAEFSRINIEPYANLWDKNEEVSHETIKLCAESGYLGAMISREYGGLEWDCISFGILNETIGRASTSLTGLFNVHTMVAQTLLKWGTDEQKNLWLPKMSKGEVIGAFALTEPGAGSDIQSIETTCSLEGEDLVLYGKKRWITFGGIADIFLVFGKLEGKPVACIVDKNTPGFSVTPVDNMLGFRAAHLAVLSFDNCRINKFNIIGRPGFAFSHLVPYALEFGRLSVAFAALGTIQGCMEICGAHVMERRTFNARLIEHGMIGTMIADMGVDLEAVKLLCFNAAKVKDAHLAEATEKILIAKYFASRAAVRHSANAVQIMGALGCNENNPVARYYRDTKAMEIIEGSNQITQMLLGKSFARKSKSVKRAQVNKEGK